MQYQIIIAAILLGAFITSTVTCAAVKRAGEARVAEAQQTAQEWERKARAYAEMLERAEEARRRAAQSEREYVEEIGRIEAQRNEQERELARLRADDEVCDWLGGDVPDGVRDFARAVFGGADCGGDSATGGAADAVPGAGAHRDREE